MIIESKQEHIVGTDTMTINSKITMTGKEFYDLNTIKELRMSLINAIFKDAGLELKK